MMSWGLRLIGAILLADFLSGLAHWIEDSYFTPESPLLGRTIRKNILHHENSRAFIKNPWHVTIRSSLVSAAFSASVLWPAGLLGGTTGLALLIAIFANQVHKWSHMEREEVPAPVHRLQEWRILQTRSHHAVHHQGEKNRCYCVLTNLLNPVLDRVQVWRRVEDLVALLTGVRPRPEPGPPHSG